MTDTNSETDEDRQIARLKIHRDLIGWIIKELGKEGIQAKRTTGEDPNGDILIVNPDNVPRVKEILRQFKKRYNT
jgi:hypothetical protein